ncbi:MAG: Cys-tRNA(Pro) deacylase [Clostridia bacterium]|nr:Cys-tRNA(Pro) deacylase [Clostridia bacterium]
MAKKENKTNAERILEQNGMAYQEMLYECKEFSDGVTVAALLGLEKESVFKTLVAEGRPRNYYVFVVPVAETLDLKKAAKAADEKSVSLIHVKDINNVTGYIRGGCSPIGMKKKYMTFIDETAQLFDRIYISGGRIGVQLSLSPDDLCSVSEAEYIDLIQE